MTMIQRSNKPKRKLYKIVIFVLFISFLLINYFKIEPLHKITLTVTSPIFKVRDIVSKPFNNFFSYFAYKRDLEQKNEELRKENSKLKIEIISSDVLKNDYKELLKQKKDGEVEIEIAKVILKPPFSSFDSFTLSGNFDDSSIGKKVYYQNIILGEIVEASSFNAVVKLYSASGHKSVAKIKDGNQFEVVGIGGGRYEIILPKDVDIKENDPIIFPENEIVLFGVVNKISVTEDDLFNKVLFNVPIDFKDINYVRVGTSLNMLE